MWAALAGSLPIWEFCDNDNGAGVADGKEHKWIALREYLAWIFLLLAYPNLAIAAEPPSWACQHYMLKDGSRAGTSAAAMKAVVARLTYADMVAIAAYLASLPQ